MSVHRECLSGALVCERFREIAQFEHAGERAQGGSGLRDRAAIERDRGRPLATSVGDERAQVKDVTRRGSRERLRPRDDGLGRLGTAVVEEDAAQFECEARAKWFGGPPRRERPRTREAYPRPA